MTSRTVHAVRGRERPGEECRDKQECSEASGWIRERGGGKIHFWEITNLCRSDLKSYW